MQDVESLARRYYSAIDRSDYAALEELLAPTFVHERPDRTLEGADRFVQFMREERPRTDTSHAIDALYRNEEAVAVRGRLLGGENQTEGERIFGFVDVFSFEADRVESIRTYTR